MPSRKDPRETNDAKEYAKLAIQYKTDDKKVADVFARLADQEISHANQLHEQAVRVIGEYAGEVPIAMKTVWDWEHSNMIEEFAAIKYLLEVYKQ